MRNLLPFVGMVLAILAQSGNMVVTKVAMADGMNKYVMIVYSYALSTLILLPLAIIVHRSERRPLTFSALCSFFLLALFGCSAQILAYVGIDLSSPTLATAMSNLVPAFTFVLALFFRIEQVHWRRSSSQAKVLGTVVSMAGAFVVIFYKGPNIFKAHPSVLSHRLLYSKQLNWIFGGFYCAADSLLSSLWFIYQVSVSKKYPAVVVIVFFQVFFSSFQSLVLASIAVTNQSAWVLKLDVGLVAILYQAMVATAARVTICAWCVQKAGPLFCAMFKPLGIIFTVVMDAIFLGDDFHLGSLVGAIIIVVGFYAVMWGKATEEKVENLEPSCHNHHDYHQVPLLRNTSV